MLLPILQDYGDYFQSDVYLILDFILNQVFLDRSLFFLLYVSVSIIKITGCNRNMLLFHLKINIFKQCNPLKIRAISTVLYVFQALEMLIFKQSMSYCSISLVFSSE